MVIFNSTDPQHPFWKNDTSQETPFFWGGGKQYLRFGDAGVLVAVGGYLGPADNQKNAPLRDMSLIDVYDIATAKWLKVTAEGDVPPPRGGLCSAVSAAPDDSSFQMIIYGGFNGTNTLNDMYLLTMPAFRWIKVNTTAVGSPNLDTNMGRMNALCASYQDRQMLVVGGRSNLVLRTKSCDTGYPILRLLDTTTFQWQTSYPLPNTTYQIPQGVIDVIGGRSDGGAKPASEWQQTLGDLVPLFSKIVPRYHPPALDLRSISRNESKSSTTSTQNSSAGTNPRESQGLQPSDSSANSKPSAGIIAGAVIGAAGVMLLISTAMYIFLFRRRRRRQVQAEIQVNSWEKSELSSADSSKPWARTYQLTRAEVDGSKTQSSEPTEVEAAQRYELPSAPPETFVYELAAVRGEDEDGEKQGPDEDDLGYEDASNSDRSRKEGEEEDDELVSPLTQRSESLRDHRERSSL